MLESGARYRFVFTKPYRTTVVLRALGPSEHEKNEPYLAALSYTAARPVSSDTARALASLAEGCMPPNSLTAQEAQQRTGTWSALPSLSPDGKFDPSKAVPIGMLPPLLTELFAWQGRTDSLHALRVAEVIAWRHNLRKGKLAFRTKRRAQWSIDRRLWRRWPADIRGETSLVSEIRISGRMRSWIRARVNQGLGEPFAHMLLREAEDLCISNKRASVILTAAAFETGVKSCIITVLPEVQWLIKHRSSPPALQLFNTYLHEIAPRIAIPRVARLPKQLYQELESGLTLRNRVVHSTTEIDDHEFPRRFPALVRDLLYLMDAYAGDSWAIDMIRPNTRGQLGLSGTT